MALSAEELAWQEKVIEQIEALAERVGSRGPDKRFQVTRRLLEAASWRITHNPEDTDA